MGNKLKLPYQRYRLDNCWNYFAEPNWKSYFAHRSNGLLLFIFIEFLLENGEYGNPEIFHSPFTGGYEHKRHGRNKDKPKECLVAGVSDDKTIVPTSYDKCPSLWISREEEEKSQKYVNTYRWYIIKENYGWTLPRPLWAEG